MKKETLNQIVTNFENNMKDYECPKSIRLKLKENLRNELSKSTTGVKYSKLNEYQQDGIDDNIKGLKELMNKIY